MQPGQEWTTSYYAGILTLLLSSLAVLKVRNARTTSLGLLALIGVLCAMGDSGFLLKVLKTLAPALGLTRFPIKFVVLTIFCLAAPGGGGNRLASKRRGFGGAPGLADHWRRHRRCGCGARVLHSVCRRLAQRRRDKRRGTPACSDRRLGAYSVSAALCRGRGATGLLICVFVIVRPGHLHAMCRARTQPSPSPTMRRWLRR